MERTNLDGYPTQQEIANFLSKYFPEDKLSYEYWGLSSKNPNDIVKKVLLCTTPTSAVIDISKEQGYDLVVSHHGCSHSEVPHIVYHSSMDESEKGHNHYFINKMGLKNKRQYHKVLLGGDTYKPLTLDLFKQLLIKRGFEINGVVWESINADDKIESVLYCSGAGGILLYPNPYIDAKQHPADVYVTGELIGDNSILQYTPFKYIIELGHTSSEKPLFKWIKNILMNRWRNLEINLADNKIDIC